MSSDDIILILQHRGKFKGYWVMGDFDYKVKDLLKLTPRWTVNTIEEAILVAQTEDTEYGYRFVNLKRVEAKNSNCLTCSNVADSCLPEDGPCGDTPEKNIDSSFADITSRKEEK